MLDVMRWAAEQFQACLLESPLAESARVYLGERKLAGETVRRFGLGFAPASWDWLVQRAADAQISVELLETVGLIAKRNEGRGWYDRFRDRVIFPIRDLRGMTVGFGGRVLPGAAEAERGPKYYNSAETPLFSKSDQLYGADQARQAATKAGCVAIVEGYTDVLMAHQHGIANVVATMGTALNVRHVQKLKALAPRVVLVFDADAGGETGVDRAMEVFVSHDVDLRIATLPEGLDPCDLLVERGPEPFRQAIESAVEVFEFKLQRVWATLAQSGVDGQRRAVEQMLATLAAGPEERSVKLELMVNRIAHRLNLKEETLWSRLKELRGSRRRTEAAPQAQAAEAAPPEAEERSAPAARHEVRLLEVLLAYPGLVTRAKGAVKLEEIEHPGLRLLLGCLYRIEAEGRQADLDHLRGRLDNERLLETARKLQERGLEIADGSAELRGVAARFVERRITQLKQSLRERLEAGDTAAAAELQERLKELSRQSTFETTES
jgi:DNA primase